MLKSNHLRAVITLLLAAVLFSLGGIFIKLSTWDAIPLNGARSAISAVVIALILRKMRRGDRPKLNQNMILGAVAYTATNITFMLATKLTTAANAVFLQFTAPVWVILGSLFFLAEKPRRIDWLTVGIILPGMALFFADQLSAEGLTGNFIAMFSGVCMACMVMLLRSEADSAGDIVILGSIFAMLIGIPFMFNQDWTLTNIALIVALGVFQLGISFGFYIYAIPYLSAVEIIVIMSLEPILNPVWVALFAGETPGIWAMVGGGIVVLAITGRVLFSLQQDSQKSG